MHRRTLDRWCQYAVFPRQTLASFHTTDTNRLLVYIACDTRAVLTGRRDYGSPVKRSTVGIQAFLDAYPTWNALPEDVTSSRVPGLKF